jgi:hypothetical protein
MKGEGLITNTITLGVVVAAYYMSMVAIGWLYNTFAGIPIISAWTTNMPSALQLLWSLVIYIIIPICIVVAFIMRTRPQEQNVYGYGRY